MNLRDQVRHEAEAIIDRRFSVTATKSLDAPDLSRPPPPRAIRAGADRRPAAFSAGPCPRCGIRGDLGCDHQRPFDGAVL